MDGIRQSALKALRGELLNLLWHDALTSGVGLTTLRSGVVDSVRDRLFDSLGKLFLGRVWDNGVASGVGCVGARHSDGVGDW